MEAHFSHLLLDPSHSRRGWMEEWIAGRRNGSSSAMTEMRDGGGRGRRRIAEQIARPSKRRPFEIRGKNVHGFVILPGEEVRRRWGAVRRRRRRRSSFAKKRRREIVSADYV